MKEQDDDLKLEVIKFELDDVITTSTYGENESELGGGGDSTP